MKKILILFLVAQALVAITACQHTDDVPPLSQEERNELDSIANEYNKSMNQ